MVAILCPNFCISQKSDQNGLQFWLVFDLPVPIQHKMAQLSCASACGHFSCACPKHVMGFDCPKCGKVTSHDGGTGEPCASKMVQDPAEQWWPVPDDDDDGAGGGGSGPASPRIPRRPDHRDRVQCDKCGAFDGVCKGPPLPQPEFVGGCISGVLNGLTYGGTSNQYQFRPLCNGTSAAFCPPTRCGCAFCGWKGKEGEESDTDS